MVWFFVDSKALEEGYHMIRVKVLERCDFPIVQKALGTFNVLVIPSDLHRFFDEGYHAVRVSSLSAGALLPSFGGGTAVGRSLTPHQDHDPRDRRRFLAFSKPDAVSRGSATYFAEPEYMRTKLEWLLAQFSMRREEIQREFVYRPPYMVSKEQLYQCFEPNGLDRLVASITGPAPSVQTMLFTYTGILAYLLQDRFGDEIVGTLLQEDAAHIWIEHWNEPGLLIVDNSRTFHGRHGPNVPLNRNWLIAA